MEQVNSMDGRNGAPRTVVVTGASGGVGRATAHAFASKGCRIALLARGRKGLEDCKLECESMGAAAVLVVPTDVADDAAVEAAADRVERELGEIDVWVNDAMATIFARVVDTTPQEFKRATEVTYLGTVNGTMAALRRMVPRDRGVIVQVGSALAYRAIPLQAAYCGAKFAIRGFTDSLRTELMHDGSKVWVTMVQLPGLNTPQFSWCRTRLPLHPMPVPPVFQPEVAAEGIVWASEHRRREVCVGGSSAVVVNGNKLLPGLGDRYLAKTGVDSQQMQGMPVDPDRPDNLFEPVEEKAATHGIFDDMAKDRSFQLEANVHRDAIAGAAGAAVSLIGAAAARRRARR